MVKKVMQSFRYAINGLVLAFRSEMNLRIHFVAALVVLLVSIILDISRTDLIILLIMIAFVLITEIFNTSVEKVLDYINPEYDAQIKAIKDLSAGAVLLSALFAIIVGLIVIFPYILK